ncbi:hypothetical protein OVA29_09235 [Exiguobacterium sp. SL14]|nr:hypothetical protein [Exiguobacterium sp. SL14]MCY1690827.1 hypothetical protein [Exiguobacterium sp. SL14]
MTTTMNLSPNLYYSTKNLQMRRRTITVSLSITRRSWICRSRIHRLDA